MTTTYEALLEALEEGENQLTLYALGDWEEERGNLVRAEAWRYLGRYGRRAVLGDHGYRWYKMVSPNSRDHPSFNEMSHWLPSDWSEKRFPISTGTIPTSYLVALAEYERGRQ